MSITMDVHSYVVPTMHQNAMDKLNQTFARLNEDDEGEGGDKSGGVLARK